MGGVRKSLCEGMESCNLKPGFCRFNSDFNSGTKKLRN